MTLATFILLLWFQFHLGGVMVADKRSSESMIHTTCHVESSV